MFRKFQELRIDDMVLKPSLKDGNSNQVKPAESTSAFSIGNAKQIVFKQIENEGLRPKTLLAYNFLTSIHLNTYYFWRHRKFPFKCNVYLQRTVGFLTLTT